MNILNFTNSTLVETLGWTLLHSIWQIALISLVLFAALKILRGFSANARYLAAIATLVFAVAVPFLTFVELYQNAPTDLSRNEFAASNTGEIKRDVPAMREKASPSKDADVPLLTTNRSDFFAAIENLKNFCAGNFAAALPFVVGLWLFGVMLFALRLAGGAWHLRIYKTREISAPTVEWQERFAALCRQLKITQTVKFLQSNLIETPVVVGWLKPVILVPASVFLQISVSELETIIAHELVHVRRADALVNFAQSFTEVLFFYHPCVWWISSVIRGEREFAADEAVVAIMENSHIVYASALANLEEIRLVTNRTAPPVLVAANGGNLMLRITKILQEKTGRKRGSSAWSAMLSLALLSAVLLTLFSFNSNSLVNAQTKTANKKIAVGFVSIPPLDRSENPPKDADATARLLIEKLKSHKIPAIGFLQGSMISDGDKFYPIRANIARLWRDAGFEIGIGNFKHIWFYDTPYDEYVASVEKNEAVAKKLLDEKNLSLKYFSYPYLNTGKTADERNRFEAWLKTQNITPVKYTVDNQEWMYSYAYDMARNDNDVNTMKQIQSEFLDYMSKMFEHYEKYSLNMFGRDINQTMVLTSSRLVADSSDELFGMIEKRGYKFVTMDEAQSDAAYNTPENFYGKSGISWFERWQMAKGAKLLNEPQVSEYVQKIWDESRAKK